MDLDCEGTVNFAEFMLLMHQGRVQNNGSAFATLADKVDAKLNRIPGQGVINALLLLTFLVLIGSSSIVFHFFKVH